MRVAIITEDQKNLLNGREFSQRCKFNPVKDRNENWVLTEQEIKSCSVYEFQFLKSLPLTEYEKP